MLRGTDGDSRRDAPSLSLDQRFVESLFERVPAVVYVAEPGNEGAWLYVSRQIEQLLGYSTQEWCAESGIWARSIHPDDRERVLIEEANAVPIPGNRNRLEYRMIRKTGEVIWVIDDHTLELSDDGAPLWHGVMQEINDRKKAEQQLERLATRQASIAALGEQAMVEADLARLMTSATRLLRGGGAPHAFVWERLPRGDRTDERLRLRSGLERTRSSSALLAAEGTYVASALRSNNPVVIADWQREGECEEGVALPACLGQLGIRSTIAVVIEGENGPFGVLDIHSEQPDYFEAGDVHLAQSAANVLASAIDRRRADQALRHRVLHDQLTGLPNRQLFLDLLEQALRRSSQTDSSLAVMFLDLDHFKVINDSLGHHAGDQVLEVVAPRLIGRLRPNDVVARFGGDEFGMLVEDIVDEQEALAIADRIGRAIARPISIDGMEHFVTASIGIAVADPSRDSGRDPESLIRDADAAMYRAKERGRARYQLFGEEMRAHAMRRLEIQSKLRHAVGRSELFLEYQPIVELESGRLTGVEALVRWNHPEWGQLPALDFIPVAEESGLIGEIGKWVVREALRQIREWDSLAPDARPLNLAVNISAQQVAQFDFAEEIRCLIEEADLDAHRLHLEITERVLAEQTDPVRETLGALDELGVGLALDDFGTGYSSLAYLNRFPFKWLKIDQSFVQRLGSGGDDEREARAIVEAILAMASALSLEVVAEGVSEPRQAEILKMMGCRNAQGFLFAHPSAPAIITDLVLGQARLKSAAVE